MLRLDDEDLAADAIRLGCATGAMVLVGGLHELSCAPVHPVSPRVGDRFDVHVLLHAHY
jgi:hypothetical protein